MAAKPGQDFVKYERDIQLVTSVFKNLEIWENSGMNDISFGLLIPGRQNPDIWLHQYFRG